MNAVKQAIWMFIALFSLALSSWYFASSPTLIKLDEKTLANTVDIIMHNLVVHQFDGDGHLTHYLQTSLMRHTPLNNAHYLKNPHIIVTQTNQKPWDIRSRHAQALYNGKQITFHEHVIIHQDKSEHSEASNLATEEITYFPDSKFATTLKKVEYTQADNIVTSLGMNAFLEENRVQLFNHAQGSYAPTHV